MARGTNWKVLKPGMIQSRGTKREAFGSGQHNGHNFMRQRRYRSKRGGEKGKKKEIREENNCQVMVWFPGHNEEGKREKREKSNGKMVNILPNKRRERE